MDEYTQIGSIVASFGLKGEVVLQHTLTDTLADEPISSIFISFNKGSYIPYFITSMRKKNKDMVYLKLEEVDSREAARDLLKKKVFLKKKDFQPLITPGSELYWLQFVIEEEKEGRLGKIEEIMPLPQGQILAKVFKDENELLIPLSDETILEVNQVEKVIYVSLPEGLLDIYEH